MKILLIYTMLVWVLLPMIGVNLYPPYRMISEPEPQQIAIDVTRSIIHWKGTKMLGLGKHEGIVKLQSGFILLEKDILCGGEFMIDMQTIQVTDIPQSDPIPRRNLTNHLKDEDFFAVSRFPTAKLTIIQAHKQNATQYRILANLTIKNITRSIEFNARMSVNGTQKFSWQASITFNRHLWDITFKGSALQNNLVDDEILLEVMIYAK